MKAKKQKNILNQQRFQILFGMRIKELREEKGLTQEGFCLLINRSTRSVQRLECGNVNPNLFYMNCLANALNIKLSELLKFDVKK